MAFKLRRRVIREGRKVWWFGSWIKYIMGWRGVVGLFGLFSSKAEAESASVWQACQTRYSSQCYLARQMKALGAGRNVGSTSLQWVATLSCCPQEIPKFKAA